MGDLKAVSLAATGVYLPGEPIPFDQIENYLGSFEQASPHVKKLSGKLRALSRELIGIKQCHFALDPTTKQLTESNTSLTTKAINNALGKAGLKANDLDCIIHANFMPDYHTPPTSTLIQEALGITACAEMEIHSNCTGITKGLQVAFDAIRLGRYKTVAVSYAQLSSPYLLASYYNQAKVGVENLLLRWFLSDSAGAMILRADDGSAPGIRLENVYNESLGGELPAGMWQRHGLVNMNMLSAFENGHHHLGQDYKAVEKLAPRILIDGFKRMTEKNKIKVDEIAHVIVTIPSLKLLTRGQAGAREEFLIPPEKWFSNVPTKGYTGASSVVIALDEMLERGLFKKGESLAGVTIESSKWMVGGFILKHT